jgi:hypothetical protein
MTKQFYIAIVLSICCCQLSVAGAATNAPVGAIVTGKLTSADLKLSRDKANYSFVYTLNTALRKTVAPNIQVWVLWAEEDSSRGVYTFSTGTKQGDEEVDVSSIKTATIKDSHSIPSLSNVKLIAWRIELQHKGKVLDVRLYPSSAKQLKAVYKAENIGSNWYEMAKQP